MFSVRDRLLPFSLRTARQGAGFEPWPGDDQGERPGREAHRVDIHAVWRMEGNQLKTLEFRWEPVERESEGCEIIGSLSQIFARYYQSQTLAGSEVVQILAPPRPKRFSPLVSSDYKGKVLPLWRFVQEPNFTMPRQKRM